MAANIASNGIAKCSMQRRSESGISWRRNGGGVGAGGNHTRNESVIALCSRNRGWRNEVNLAKAG